MSRKMSRKTHRVPHRVSRKSAILSIVVRILAGERDLDRIKRQECKRFGISGMIKNPEILANILSVQPSVQPSARPSRSSSCVPAALSDLPAEKISEIRALLLKKPTKTLSGVTPIAVMIQPQGSCKWGCIYCPVNRGLAAKSYTGFEPAALRARQFNFDPYMQASSRVSQLEEAGHPADKCEVIIMGGTFLQTEGEYKRSFIKGVYDGLNGFRASSLKDAINANEKAKTHRVVGLTIETRPDICVPYIPEILSYGGTRVELGVQHADDTIYRVINRGHDVRAVVDSTRELKDAAFKVLYHIMPGLPGSDRKKDISFVKKLFASERFRPDMLKIYPTLVLEGTGLSEMAKRGEYVPYSSEEAADVISEFYRHIPKYVRVMRIQRDIPANLIMSGVKKSNLRELVESRVREKRIVPKEIRYREVGLQKRVPELSDFDIHKLSYKASGGKEFFISFENGEYGKNTDGRCGGKCGRYDRGNCPSGSLLAGFIRMRFPSKQTMQSDCALIRELHIYGSEVPLHSPHPYKGHVQHTGFGSRLLMAAEELAVDQGKDTMVVISGVGVREYYRKHGYRLVGSYMTKDL